MNVNEILSKCDHTILSQTATLENVLKAVEDGIKYGVASVCIPPCYVKQARDYAQGKVKICTVIGFPNGYNQTKVKVFETKQAISCGADEIDMVINVGALKQQNYDYIKNEIRKVKSACKGKVLKVIIETCLLTDDEKVKMCQIINECGADYVKTSTGFSTAGATLNDAKILIKNAKNGVKVKASGGISSLDDAIEYLSNGVSRLGTSKIVKIIKEKGE